MLRFPFTLMSQISCLVNEVLPFPSIGFTCTESSYHSTKNKCSNVFNDDRLEWVTGGESKGAWIHLSFHAKVMIRKILYRHNRRKSTTNQYFKDVLLEFSDQTNVNVTLEYPNDNQHPEREIYFKIDPPVLSSSLTIKVLSGYNLSMSDRSIRPQDWKTRYGISYIQIYGSQMEGKLILIV